MRSSSGCIHRSRSPVQVVGHTTNRPHTDIVAMASAIASAVAGAIKPPPSAAPPVPHTPPPAQQKLPISTVYPNVESLLTAADAKELCPAAREANLRAQDFLTSSVDELARDVPGFSAKKVQIRRVRAFAERFSAF
jgi:hypothetical protein